MIYQLIISYKWILWGYNFINIEVKNFDKISDMSIQHPIINIIKKIYYINNIINNRNELDRLIIV
jgi:hypothetical protein